MTKWLHFHFHFLMEKDRGLLKLSGWKDWLKGKLGLLLMGGAMLSKSLIQFSVHGWDCVPSLFLTWDQTMGEVMKIMSNSFKRSYAHFATLSDPNLTAGHHWPISLQETPGHSQESLGQSLVGSLLLSPRSSCAQAFVCALQESISQSCVSFGGFMAGLMPTSSKRAYAILGLLHTEPFPLWQAPDDL